MKKKFKANPIRILIPILLFIIQCSFGCAEKIQSSLLDAPLEIAKLNTRATRISNITVVDERPAEELEQQSVSVRYALFLGFYFQGAEGDLRPAAKWYSPDTLGEMKTVVKKALRQSELFDTGEQEDTVSVQIKLKHLYAFSHYTYDFGYLLTSAYVSITDYHSYGFAAADLLVYDSNGKIIGRRTVTGTSEIESLNGTQKERERENQSMSSLAGLAAANMASNITKAIEAIIADRPLATPQPIAADASTFYICRAISEGPYMEVAGVDYETGTVTADSIVPRTVEPFSAVDEWVVDPYGGTQFLMASEDYDNLIRKLEQKYEVGYFNNVRVARFLGLKR